MSHSTPEPTEQDLFAELFVTQQARIFGFIATMLPNRTEADEVFQQTSLILWRKWKNYDPERNFLNWACGVARLEVFNHLRRMQRTGSHLSEPMMARLAEQYVKEEREIRDRHEDRRDHGKGHQRRREDPQLNWVVQSSEQRRLVIDLFRIVWHLG